MGILTACTASSDTALLSPVVTPGGPVEMMAARGYGIAVSRMAASDVAIFAIAHDKYIILWVRYENYSKLPADVSPAKITGQALGKKNEKKEIKIFSTELKSKGASTPAELKNLNNALAGVYQLLKGSAASPGPDTRLVGLKEEWKEHGSDYQSIDQALLKPTTLGVNQAVEGYVVLQRIPALRYILNIPLAAETHQFELVSQQKASK